MCGGLLYQVSSQPHAHFRYQLGRLLAYLLLGLLSGSIGGYIQDFQLNNATGLLLTLLMVFWLFWSAYRMFTGRIFHLIPLPVRYFQKIPSQAFFLGLGSALIPCHWLHGFTLTLLASSRIGDGALLMFAFWLGNLVPLSLGVLSFKKLSTKFLAHSNRVGAIAYLCFGLLSLWWRLKAPAQSLNPQDLLCLPKF
jgi:sulfite exporter TauE/SafE